MARRGCRACAPRWRRVAAVHPNLLIFVPPQTAFGFEGGAKLTASLLAFLAFSCLASATYLLLTCIYSRVLKERVLLDVLMLSALYTLRIIAGDGADPA